jgi:hypothetical protein
LLKRFGMKDAKPAKTPMGTDGHTDLNKGGKSIDQKARKHMWGEVYEPLVDDQWPHNPHFCRK